MTASSDAQSSLQNNLEQKQQKSRRCLYQNSLDRDVKKWRHGDTGFIIFGKMEEQNDFLRVDRPIRRRVIRHGKISQASVNKNCPKFIVGNCWYLFQKEILAMADADQIEYIRASFKKTQDWIDDGFRDRLNLAHLTYLFGVGSSDEEKRRNYSNSKAFCRFLARMALDILVQNKKVEKPLSYLICLEKLTARLPNPKLVYKLQFK